MERRLALQWTLPIYELGNIRPNDKIIVFPADAEDLNKVVYF